MTPTILKISGLNKHFGGLHATNDLNLELKEGDKFAIIGPNGAGKSTFFNLITGYHRPDSGTIVFNNKEITGLPSYKIARAGISRAFQVSNIFPRLTILENVRSAVQAQKRVSFNVWTPAAGIGTEATENILSLCDLAEKSRLIAGVLSQGDKKKLELAIALAAKPRLLLLDEPTAGMSSEETTDTMQLVDRLNKEFNLTILFTEHDMSVVFNHALRIALLHHGHIACEGNPEEIRNNELVQRIYLGEEHS